jgi:hypothetical protein
MAQSITRPGGSGVYVLTFKECRLAYLSQISSIAFEFYEMWNQELWGELAAITGHPHPSLLIALQMAADDGTLGLFRLIRTPTDRMHRTDYNLKGCLLQNTGFQKAIGPHLILSQLVFDPAPQPVHEQVTDSPTGSLPSKPVTEEIRDLIEPYLSITHNRGAVHSLAQVIQEVLDR